MTAPVAIFWDYENCHPRSDLTGYDVVHGIRNVALTFGSVNLFKAYVEFSEQTTTESLGLRSELQSSGVSLTDCGRKDVADKMILVDILTYAIDNPPPATIILISGDRDFAYAISVLRLRQYRVVLVAPSLPSPHSLKSQASTVLEWDADILKYGREIQSLGARSPDPSEQRPNLHLDTCMAPEIESNTDSRADCYLTTSSSGRRINIVPGPDLTVITRSQSNHVRRGQPSPVSDLAVNKSCPVDMLSPSIPRVRSERYPIAKTHPSPEPPSTIHPVPVAKSTRVPRNDHFGRGIESRTNSQKLLTPENARTDSWRAPAMNNDRYLRPQTNVVSGIAKSIPDEANPVTHIVQKASRVSSPSNDSRNRTQPRTDVELSLDNSHAGEMFSPPASSSSFPYPQTLATPSRHSERHTLDTISGKRVPSSAAIVSLTDLPATPCAIPLASSPGHRQLKENTPTSEVIAAPNSTSRSGNAPYEFRSMFQPLVERLEILRRNGHEQPLRSRVGSDLLAANKSIYKEVGVKGFTQYVILAEQHGIVRLGGTAGKAWVSLQSPGSN